MYLMCANSFCGQKDCYCVPRWVHGQIMFTLFRETMPKYSSQTTDFNLFMFPSSTSLTNCFIHDLTFHKCACNHGKLCESLCSRSCKNGFWMACVLHPDVKCHLPKVQEKGLKQHGPGLTLWHVSQQEPDAWSSQKRNVTFSKVQEWKKIRSPSSNAYVIASCLLILHWIKSIISTNGDTRS